MLLPSILKNITICARSSSISQEFLHLIRKKPPSSKSKISGKEILLASFSKAWSAYHGNYMKTQQKIKTCCDIGAVLQYESYLKQTKMLIVFWSLRMAWECWTHKIFKILPWEEYLKTCHVLCYLSQPSWFPLGMLL